jgi:CBS domain containing-hemolysin-like protein
MQIHASILVMLVPPLLLIEGLFSGSEIALLSADKLTLKRNARGGNNGAKLALELATHPERVLSVTLLITSICVTALSALIALYCLDRFGANSHWIAVAISSPMIVLLGELIPKTIYQRHATRIAPWAAYPVTLVYSALYPVTRTLSLYTSRVSRMIGPIEELLTGKKRTTREELRSLMSYGKSETEIKSSEKRMIKRIFDFADTEAKHALIPLVKVEAIEESATVKEALEGFERHRHSRLPVYSERIDNIIGVLESSDLFSAELTQPIRNSMSSAHYIAETQSLDDLMADMHREDLEMVVVVDEHGGAVGILTLEDIVEEIVGEIRDEYDQESRPYKEIAEEHWVVQARMEIDAINDQLKIHLPVGDYETLSGFLLQQFGRIPETRDELFFNTSSGLFKFTIRQATERAIQSVEVEKIE